MLNQNNSCQWLEKKKPNNDSNEIHIIDTNSNTIECVRLPTELQGGALKYSACSLDKNGNVYFFHLNWTDINQLIPVNSFESIISNFEEIDFNHVYSILINIKYIFNRLIIYVNDKFNVALTISISYLKEDH